MGNVLPITDRTRAFAVRIVKACSFLDERPGVARTLGKQLLRSGTSIGANVHESRSAQSDKDFISKLEIALKEARETEYWLKVLLESEIVKPEKFQPLLIEANELISILVASVCKMKDKQKS